MLDIRITDDWHATFPGAHLGVLLVGKVDNSGHAAVLDGQKRGLEARLRQQFSGLSRAELRELDVLRAYRDYYRKFDQTYHVQLQLESVAHKGKALPNVSPLVDASFLAELETLILTAGHDADRLAWPLTFDVTRGGEAFTQMSGAARSLRAGDMLMRDAEGIVCTVLYGQDRRTPISPGTRRVLYVAYAPQGVGGPRVRHHLETLRDHVHLFARGAVTEGLEVYAARVSPGA